MFDIGFYEILVCLIVGILLFNPKDFYSIIAKLVNFGLKFKKYFYKNFKDYYNLFDNDLQDTKNFDDFEEKIKKEFNKEYDSTVINKEKLNESCKEIHYKKYKNNSIKYKNAKYVSRSKY